jgi:predicted RNA-binding Zn ribbon-like protein
MRHRKVLADEAKVPDKKLRRFLLDLANAWLTDAEDHSVTIFHLYPQFLPPAPSKPEEAQQNFPLLMALMNRWKEFDPRRLPTKLEACQREIVAEMRDRLRAVWEAGDAEAAGERLGGFESFMNEVMAAGPASGQPAPDAPQPQRDAMAPGALPPAAPLSQALAYLGRNLRRLKKCANRGCDSPFFIAKRPDDQCCTDVCANEMRGRSKKRYWEGKRKGLTVPGRGVPKPAAKKVAAKSTGIRGE